MGMSEKKAKLNLPSNPKVTSTGWPNKHSGRQSWSSSSPITSWEGTTKGKTKHIKQKHG